MTQDATPHATPMPPLSLGEAARLTGKSKSTLARAVKSGRLSAGRHEDGSYTIDPAELSRAYEVRPGGTVARGVAQDAAPPPAAPPVAELMARLAAAEAALDEARGALGREREAVDDLRRRLDRSEERLVAFLRAPPRPGEDRESPKQVRRPWWRLRRQPG